MDRIVLVTKPTRLEELVEEHLTEGMARFMLESRGESIEPYLREHEVYWRAVDSIRRQIPNDLAVASATRAELPSFLFREKDLIIVCGPDGLFVNLAQYVDTQLVLPVNPDPSSILGKLMIFQVEQVHELIDRVRAGKHRVERLPFVRASIDEDRVVWGINDIFIGRSDHVSARYKISHAGRSEHHSSSGVIASTGVGASGWLRSVAVMVDGLASGASSSALDSLPKPTDPELVFVAREPFPSPTTGTSIVTGRVTLDAPLELTCEMPRGGVVFSDGMVDRWAEWPAGSTVRITVGQRSIGRIAPRSRSLAIGRATVEVPYSEMFGR